MLRTDVDNLHKVRKSMKVVYDFSFSYREVIRICLVDVYLLNKLQKLATIRETECSDYYKTKIDDITSQIGKYS